MHHLNACDSLVYNYCARITPILITIQNNHLSLSLSNTLYIQHIAGIHPRNKSAIALTQLCILPSIQPNLGLSILRHRQVHIHIPLPAATDDVTRPHGPTERRHGRDNPRPHDKVRMDGDSVCDLRGGRVLLRRRGLGARRQWRQNGHERLALGVFAKRPRVILRLEPVLPREHPDLQEMHRFVAFVLFRVGDALAYC